MRSRRRAGRSALPTESGEGPYIDWRCGALCLRSYHGEFLRLVDASQRLAGVDRVATRDGGEVTVVDR